MLICSSLRVCIDDDYFEMFVRVRCVYQAGTCDGHDACRTMYC